MCRLFFAGTYNYIFKNMKTIIISAVLLLLIYLSANSQPKDVIYIDFGILMTGGTKGTVGFGLNYERMLNNNVSVRTGINFSTDGGFGVENQSWMMGIPISAQFFTSANNRLEAGIGSGVAFNIKGFVAHNSLPCVTARIGYRYQKREGEGKFIKAGLEFPSNIYFSLIGVGYSK